MLGFGCWFDLFEFCFGCVFGLFAWCVLWFGWFLFEFLSGVLVGLVGYVGWFVCLFTFGYSGLFWCFGGLCELLCFVLFVGV